MTDCWWTIATPTEVSLVSRVIGFVTVALNLVCAAEQPAFLGRTQNYAVLIKWHKAGGVPHKQAYATAPDTCSAVTVT